ncbi:MAG: RIP metalloprotease RseP [Desulfobacter sp.]
MVQTIEYAVAFVVTIGVLVFVHELGHFLVARLCGVGVDVFSLGFGPKILKKKYGQTEYCISAIPLGGYVKMVGEEPGREIPPEDMDRSFTHKSLFRKSLIVAAGPAFNFLLAILIYFMFYMIAGTYTLKPIVGKVAENAPAEAAGIMAGDVIREINGNRIDSFEDVQRLVGKSGGNTLVLVAERGKEMLEFTLAPRLSEQKDLFGDPRYLLGIESEGGYVHKRLTLLQALGTSLENTWIVTQTTFKALGKMLDFSFAKENLGGPLVIAKVAGETARAGLDNFIGFIALLSINLGIINLLPIPVLDGGHLLFFGIEAVIRKPVSQKLREKLIQFGAAVLVTLMIFVIYNDIAKLFFNGG